MVYFIYVVQLPPELHEQIHQSFPIGRSQM